MQAIGHHITLRLAVDRPLLLSVAERRAAARATLRLGEDWQLLLFVFADTHAHVLVVEPNRSRAGEFSRRLEIALYRTLGIGPFEHARIRSIDDVWHLGRSVGYVLRQRHHHGVSSDPWMEASNVPDLLGLREVGAYTRDTLHAWLPRFSRDELVACIPVALDDVIELSSGPRAEAALAHLEQAAAAAAALPTLRSKRPDAVAAKCAAVHVGSTLTSTRQLAVLLDLRPRTIRELRQRAARPELVRAVRRQLWLRYAYALAEAQREASLSGG